MTHVKTIKIPDIGGARDVDVIEILVHPGDEVLEDTPLVTLETDKASMEIPSPFKGVVQSMQLKIGDKVAEGDVILLLAVDDAQEAPLASSEVILSEEKMPEAKLALEAVELEAEAVELEAEAAESETTRPADLLAEATFTHAGGQSTAVLMPEVMPVSDAFILAGPGVRRLARELGVNLKEVQGSGKKNRITREDLEQFVKQKLSEKTHATGFALPAAKTIDFSQFGCIETKPLNKIKRITGENLHRAWLTIPHVTQFDDADITDLEAFRQSELKAAEKAGYKLTMLAFVCKVVAHALAAFPQFNSSLDASGQYLIYKKYYHIGIAVETPNGLVVPVIQQVNQLSVGEIAKEMARLSTKAREKGLMPGDMQGGTFTLSSLGGIGGTAFTPLVNHPEVAILGLSRAVIKPQFEGEQFVPRLMLPLSLSYDHRVIDGAEAARFTRFMSDGLSDMRRILL